MKKLQLSLLLVFCICSTGFAQKQNNVWFFGDKAGLDFNFTPPKPITSDLYTLEGVASISDPAGHLLFYTNGATLWDRDQNIMPNGSGLLGGESSTQAALIVPLPGSCNLYYVFTTEDQSMDGGLAYSIVDMCLNNGFGDVVVATKNTLVIDKATEKVTAVLHANGVDIWILTHTHSSNKFQSFLLSASGLNLTPVVSAVGSNYASNAIIGPIRASHDGSKIVSSASFRDICEMFDFDKATGVLSNAIDLNDNIPGQRSIYGIEFSPDDHLLYLSDFFAVNFLYQLDLQTNVLTILNTAPGDYHYGALQMGTDKKIYMVRNEESFVDVIHNPNISGTGCQYEEHSIDLLPGTSGRSGLPNFAPYSFFRDSSLSLSLGSDTTICAGESIVLSVSGGKNCPSTYVWSDGTTSPEKIITTAGEYWVRVENSCAVYTDTIQIDVVPVPFITISDSTNCAGESVLLDATFPGATYLWSDGSTTPTLLATQTGIYAVTISNVCGDFFKSVEVVIAPTSQISITKDICAGGSFEGYTKSGVYIDTFTLSSGCDSIRTLQLNVIQCETIIQYDLEACASVMLLGTNMDYTEFVPTFPVQLPCAEVSTGHLFRDPPQMNKHSCTPGINGSIAMCVSALNTCTYNAGNQASIVIEFSIDPQADSIAKFTGLEFYEQSPVNFNWIDGDNGPNNFPTRFGIRVLKNGTEIFRQANITTTNSWTLKSFSFIDQDLFRVETNTTFRIELLPYCPVGNGAIVSAWDIDQVKIFAGCISALAPNPGINGKVVTHSGQYVSNAAILLSQHPEFINAAQTITGQSGEYHFDQLVPGGDYFIKGYKNDDVLKGVSTLDLVRIQKHLLGKEPFQSLHQFVAADVNHSGAVSVMDLIDLRKVLLGKYPDFPGNTSWRFGEATQDMNGSEITSFREIKAIEYLQNEGTEINFTGIKTGDVNEDIQLQITPNILTPRNQASLLLTTDETAIRRDLPFTINFRIHQDISLEGLQFAMNLNDLDIIDVEGAGVPLESENFHIVNSTLFVSWNQSEPVHLNTEDILFRITCISHRNSSGLENISLVNERLMPEAYSGDHDVLPIVLSRSITTSYPSEIISFTLEPNPFHHAVSARFNLERSGVVTLRCYDISGRLLYEQVNEYSSGEHIEHINSQNLPLANGLMYCQLVCNGYTQMQKVLKL